MKKAEQIGYYIGMTIGIVIWLSFIIYTSTELYNRIFNNTGDPFTVLTFLIALAILIRTGTIKKQFRKIVDWINK